MKKYVPALLFTLYFVVQCFTLLRVGFTWDEPSILFIGKRNLDFWVSGNWGQGPNYNPQILASDGPLRMVYGAKYYPPLLPTFAAVTHEIFTAKLHILPLVAGYNIAGFLIGFIGIVVLYLVLKELGFPLWISVSVSFLYGLYPSIVGQIRNDLKDVPLAAAVLVLVFCYLKLLKSWPRKRSYVYAVIFGISFGMAMLIKPTAGLMGLIMALYWGVSLLFAKTRSSRPKIPVLISQILIVGILAFVVILFFWPWIWTDPVLRLREAITFFRTTGYKVPVLYFGKIFITGDPQGVPWHYPFGVLIAQTPILVIALFIFGAIGAVLSVKKTKDPLPLFFLFWVTITIGRFTLPMFYIYAKVRHLMDGIPGLFILSAYGLQFLGWFTPKAFKRYSITLGMLIVGLALVHELIIIVQFVPYEPSYFSGVVGGTKYIADNNQFDVEYWGSSIRESMEYIASHTDKPVTVYTCTMAHMAKYFDTDKVKTVKVALGADYYIIPNSRSWFGLLFPSLEASAKRFYTVKRTGAELMYIYKSENGHMPQCGSESED